MRVCKLFFVVGILSVFLVSGAFAAPTVSNPSFESSLSGTWTMWKGTGGNNDGLERDYYSSGLPNGVWCLAVKGFGTGGKGGYQYISSGWSTSNNYRIKVWVKNLSNTNINYSVGYKLGNTGASGGPTATYGTTVVHPSSWTQATVDLTYSGSAGVTVYLRAVNDGHSERAGFDLVQIEDLGGGGPTPTSTPAGPTPTNTPTSETPPQPPVVSNPSFESSLSGSWTMWKGSGGNSDPLERDWYPSGLPNGVWCLAVKGIGSGGKGAYQYVNNNWTVNRNYRIKVRVKNLSNTNMNYSVGYKLGNTGASGGPTATYGTTVVHPSSWTQATVELTYSGSSGVTIYLRVVNDGHAERAGFDLVEIEDLGPSGPEPTDTPPPPTETPVATDTPGGPTPTPGGPFQLSAEEFYERAKGMWFGQLIGVWMGAQYEFDCIDNPCSFDSVPTPSSLQTSRVDDDNSFEWTYMYLVQRYGWGMGYSEAEESWERHFTRLLAGANEQARGLLASGYSPPDTGSRELNSYWFFIDAQIESEVWGIMAAGLGAVTKNQSNIWAHVSNDDGACDGATFYSTMYAYAMIEQDVEKVLRATMTHYPTDSEIYGLADYVIELYHDYPTNWRTVRQILRDYTWDSDNFDGYDPEHRGIFWATNFASVLTAIMYGQGDFHDTLQLAIVEGYDADCNASTAAGFAGIINGFHGIPTGYRDNFTDNFYNWNLMVEQMPLVDSLSSMAAQAQRMFEDVLVEEDGDITGTAWNKIYSIPSDWPTSVPMSTPGPPTPTYTPVPGTPQIVNGNMETADPGGVWLPASWHAFGGNKFERQWQPMNSSYMAGVSEMPADFRPYAGIFQPVYGATPGHRYKVEADVWLTNSYLRASAGIDAYGWWDYENASYGSEISSSGEVSHSVVAQDSRLVVFIRVRSVYSGLNTGWGYIDNVTLTDLGED